MKYLILIILLSSCSVLKHTNKSDSKTESQETAKAQEKTESEKESTIKTVTTEKAQGSVNIPESTLNGEIHLNNEITDDNGEVRNGEEDDNAIVLEDDNQKVEIIPAGKGSFNLRATVKPKTIPVNIDRTVIKDEQIKEKIRKDSTGSETVKAKSESSEFGKDVKKTGLLIPWWVYVLLVLAIAGGVYWKWFR